MRDIYVTPATIADRQAIYLILREYSGVEYSIDGHVQELPPAVEQAFAVRPLASPLLRFRVGRTLICCHFFSREEMECDVSPHEITSQTDLDELLGFVRRLGDTTHQRVSITPENCPGQPIITYDPKSKAFEYHKTPV